MPGSVSASDIATRKPSRSLVSNSNNTKKGTGSSWLLSQRFCDDPLILSKGPKSLKEPIKVSLLFVVLGSKILERTNKVSLVLSP